MQQDESIPTMIKYIEELFHKRDALNNEILGAYIKLGFCLRQHEQLDAAEEIYKQALEIDQQSAAANNGLREVRREKEQRDAEIAEQKRVDHFVANINCYNEGYQQGRTAKEKGDYRLSAKLLEKALNFEPDNKYCKITLASTYRVLGEIQKAEDLCSEVLDGNNKDIAALVELSALFKDRNSLIEGYQLCRKALEIQSDNCYVLHTLGALCMRMDRKDEGEYYFEKAHKLGCKEPQSTWHEDMRNCLEDEEPPFLDQK